MKLSEVRRKAFAMPLNDPAYPPGPYKFYNREFVVITYRTDIDKLRAVVPEPLEVAGDTVAYEFIRMPDSTGFGMSWSAHCTMARCCAFPPRWGITSWTRGRC